MSESEVLDFGSGAGLGIARETRVYSSPQPIAMQSQQEPRVGTPSQWGVVEAGKVFAPVPGTIGQLPAGVYSVGSDGRQLLFNAMELQTDQLIEFSDSVADAVLAEVSRFWDSGEVFRRYGFLHRRGYILYGPQGSGKTCVVRQILARIVAADGVALVCTEPELLNMGLVVLRKIEPLRSLVCLFEDVDAIIQRSGEAQLLSILDGENQVDRVLNIATTNYPQLLDKRFVARPRRFDRIIRIENPGAEIRRRYFEAKLDGGGHDLELWTEASAGLSFAALAELIISVLCLGHELSVAAKTLRSLSGASPSDYEDRRPAGF